MKTILVVDDDRWVRNFVASTLILNGYRVIEAADGVEALELAVQHPGQIELLLTDVRMPRMQGPELCKRMRTIFPETRMVIMSAVEGQELHSNAEFLVKPFGIKELLGIVSRVLTTPKLVDHS